MRKNIRSKRVDYEVIEIVDKKSLDLQFKYNVKIAMCAVKDYLKIKKKPKFYFSVEDRAHFAEYWGTKKRRPIIVIFFKVIEKEENPRELLIRSIMHEYLHYFFDKKRLSKIFDLESEEELVERIEEDLWRKYFT